MSLQKKMMRERARESKGLLSNTMGPGKKAPPEALARQTESLVAGLIKLTHGEETRGDP